MRNLEFLTSHWLLSSVIIKSSKWKPPRTDLDEYLFFNSFIYRNKYIEFLFLQVWTTLMKSLMSRMVSWLPVVIWVSKSHQRRFSLLKSKWLLNATRKVRNITMLNYFFSSSFWFWHKKIHKKRVPKYQVNTNLIWTWIIFIQFFELAVIQFYFFSSGKFKNYCDKTFFFSPMSSVLSWILFY